MNEIKLEAKKVGEIEGKFYVPSYQRGYRWDKEEVIRLLDDMYGIYDDKSNMVSNYCLQPIVVKNSENGYELIDGQQRLTTLYLIYKYMSVVSMGFLVKEPKFSLTYETRESSEEFLKNMDMEMKDQNIDFWFIANAYETIKDWFEAQKAEVSVVMNHLNTYLAENINVIWYEVSEDEDAISLFTRLNIGKIPLTSAELVKAMFLSVDNNDEMDREKQEEIALQWDNMEKELHNNSLWYFLTNNYGNNYQTRIDLVLDLMSGKSPESKDKYFTFFEFDRMRKEGSLGKLWTDIVHTFLILKDWFNNHELYHKIGYLVASKSKTLRELYEDSKDISKSLFLKHLDDYIRESIDIQNNYGSLSYEKTNEHEQISRLLLLFNVVSVMQNGERTQWFPFDKFKYDEKGKVVWSLEHIHAQQSEGLKTQEEWRKWLELHLDSIKCMSGNEELVSKIKDEIAKKTIDGDKFKSLQKEVFEKMSVEGNVEYLHSISNLALLNSCDNAALSNSTFDVKRNEIIKMDKHGEFIPFCTKMVFLKYYTPSETNQLHFWGQPDREAYVDAINSVLDGYLNEKISLESKEVG